MKRSVLTALVLPSAIAVMLSGTALSAQAAPAAPTSSTAAATPAEGGADQASTPAPVTDEAPAPTEASSAAVEAAPADPASPSTPAPADEATPADDAPETPTTDDAPAQAPVQDEAPAGQAVPETTTGADDVVGIAAATEPGTVTISGDTEVGDLQTAVTEGWPDGTTFTYQWTRDGAIVQGATAETYLLERADAGHVVEVVVTGTGPEADDEPTTVTSDRRVVAGVAPTFTSQPGTDLTVVAGQPFSFTWTATGDPTPGVYMTADPSTLDATLPAEATATEGSGFLTIAGTTTSVGRYSFGVTPLNPVGIGELLVVDLEVVPAPAAGIVVVTAGEYDGDGEYGTASSLDGDSTTLVVSDGETASVGVYVVDEFLNPVAPEDYPAPADVTLVTSSGQGDVVGASEYGVPAVTFHGPGSRSLTVTLEGFTAVVPVEVKATAAVVPAGTDARPVAASGHLAYTGADGTGVLLALAGGLLSVGTALTVVRLRRRVQH
jgi:hypothetical protein